MVAALATAAACLSPGAPLAIVVNDRLGLYWDILERAGLQLESRTLRHVNRRTGPTGAWQTPLQVSAAETVGTGIGADIKTNANGDVFAFWPDTGNGTAAAARGPG